MKKKITAILTIALGLFVTGCEYDNFEAPRAILSGKVVFDGQPIGVRNNGPELELWQDGYPLRALIPVYINHAGEFSATLFDGQYKLVRKGNSPWLHQSTDTILVDVRGNTTLDVPVVPYFNITNESFQIEGEQIVASFEVQQIVESAQLDQVRIYLRKSMLTDHVVFDQEINVDRGSVELGSETRITAAISENLKSSDYLFVRVGVKSTASGEYCYTPVQKIFLK